MKTYGTYFQNDKDLPIKYGEINLINPERQRLRGEKALEGVEVNPIFCGFCGTDLELMRMSARGELGEKFPKGEKRLINGHEGIVYVPSEKRFAIVLIRGGDSCDPTRFTEDETYFEYGCDGADGIFCDKGYFNPDMLLHIPSEYEKAEKLPLSLAKKLVFSDPYACAVFQHERMYDIGVAQNFRVEMAKRKCSEAEAREYAAESTFERTVIFGLGTTGLFIGDQIRRNHPDAKILFVARSEETSQKAVFVKEELSCDYLSSGKLNEEETAEEIVKRLGGKATVFVGASGTQLESRLAFEHAVLGCNGIYNNFSLGPTVSFNTMPFGFKNQVIFASINFTQAHMEKAIELLCDSKFDTLVELIDKDEFTNDPISSYTDKIYSKSAPLKTAIIWNDKYIDCEK
jgi:threonine dehydrogenase-like Zn-dependent dehydrogenase